MTHKIAIIGDFFMTSAIFEAAIRAACPDADLDIASHDLPWPDEPMEHGYARAGLDGLKEYMGTPDEVVALTGDAELLVTHLAPLSAGIMERLPALALRRRLARRAGEYRHGRRPRARHSRRQHAGPQRFGGGRIRHRRDHRRDAQHHARPRCAARGQLARRSLPRRPRRAANCRK